MAELERPLERRLEGRLDTRVGLDQGRARSTAVIQIDAELSSTHEGGLGPAWSRTKYQYDSRGLLLRVLKPDFSGSEFDYDRLGDVLESRSFDEDTGQIVDGQISFSGIPLVRTVSTYDEGGQPITGGIYDPNSATPTAPVTEMQGYFDALGRAVKGVDGLGAETLNRYDGLGRVVWQKDPSDAEVEFTYDAAGNPLTQLQRSYTQNPDFASPPTIVGPAIEVTTTLEYDSLGRTKKVIDQLGAEAETFYDTRGIVRKAIDPLGNISLAVPDPLGRIVEGYREMREGGVGTGALDVAIQTTFAYDANSNLIKQWDHLGRETRFDYDLHDRQVKRSYLGLPGDTPREAQFFHDADGRVKNIIDDRGYCLDQSYDDLGRLTSVRSYETCDVVGGVVTNPQRGNLVGTLEQTFDYDGLGRMRTHTDDNGNFLVEGIIDYDVRGLVEAETLQLPNPVDLSTIIRSVGYQYDANGNRVQMTYPGSAVTAPLSMDIDRDAAGRILALKPLPGGAAQPLAAFRYEGNQNYTSAFYNPGTGAITSTMQRTYDALRRLSTHQETADGAPSPFFGRELRFDPMGNVTLDYDSVRQFGRVFRYDSLYRMDGIRWEVPNDGGQLTSLPNHQTLNPSFDMLFGDPLRTYRKAWTLDEVDNWDAVEETPPGQAPVTTDFNHNNFNEITDRDGASYSYDLGGNMLDEPTTHSPNGRFFYEYDFANRLIRVCSGAACLADESTTVARYYYDAMGRRVRKELWTSGSVTETRDFVLSGEQVLEERVIQPTAADHLDKRFYYRASLNSVLAMDQFDGSGASERYFFHRDYQASVSSVTRSDGTAWAGGPEWARSFRYDIYGELLEDTDPGSSVEVTFRFAGHYLDQETGLYYMRARYYRPEIGRFLSRDPLMYVDGMNMFAYVRNNPASLGDPLGLDAGSNDDEGGKKKKKKHKKKKEKKEDRDKRSDEQKKKDRANQPRGDALIASMMGAGAFDLALGFALPAHDARANKALKGSNLAFRGSPANLDRVQAVANQGLFGKDLVIGKDGSAALQANDEEGPPSPQQEAFEDVLEDAINGDAATSIDIVNRERSVVEDSYLTGAIDIGDIEKYGFDEPSSAITRLAHAVYEQANFKGLSRTDEFMIAHQYSIRNADDVVSGWHQLREDTTKLTISGDGGYANGRAYRTYSREGETVTVMSKVVNGNVTRVSRERE